MSMSRDEINGRVDNRGGRGSRHRRRSGAIRYRDDVRRVRARRPVPYSRAAGNAHQRDHGGPIEGTVLFLSALESEFCGEELEEIYGMFGRVWGGTVHYDRSGVSLGTGTVTFERRADALAAIQWADELRPADWPRSIEIITSSPPSTVTAPPDTYNRGTGQNRRSFAGHGGRGLRGGRGRVEPTTTSRIPTSQELDAELDAYSRETEELSRRRRRVRFSDDVDIHYF